jgi:hypothetical protein
MAHTLTPTQVEALASSFNPQPILRVRHGAGTDVDLPVIDGSLTLDGGSQERVTLTATVPIEFAPDEWSDLLIPDDAVARVYFGLGVGPEVKVGTVWLDECRIRRPEGTVTLTGFSRATRVSQAGFPFGDRRYTGTCVEVAQKIVADALGVSVPVQVIGGLTGPQVSAEEVFNGDPWQAVEDLMDAAGGEAYFNADDVLVMRAVPKADPPASWGLHVGDGGTLTRYEVALTRAPNEVRMEFRNPTTNLDVVGVATAGGMAAPSGPYGHYRRTETRDGVIGKADADKAAAEFLTRAGGLMRTVSMEGVPHPGIEVGDAVTVTFVNGVTETHRVTRLELPLTPGEPMRVETRSLPWR